MRARPLTAYLGGVFYSTRVAYLLAHDSYFDSVSWERNGANTFLFRTADGSFFVQHQVCTVDCSTALEDGIKPLSEYQALLLYWDLPIRARGFHEAFGIASREPDGLRP